MKKYSRLEVFYSTERLDVPVEPVLLSWQGPAARVKIYQGERLCFDSGSKVDSPFMPQWQPEACTFYRWDLDGIAGSFFRTAYKDDFDWAPACWMESKFEKADDTWQIPVTRFRKEFELAEPDAEDFLLNVGALGCYQVCLNGQKISDSVLAPGELDFFTRTLYQVYSVKDLLKPGRNLLEADLASGWHSGTIARAWDSHSRLSRCNKMALILRLEAVTSDGSKLLLASGDDWLASCSGPWRYSDHYMGEFYDGTREFENFTAVKVVPGSVKLDCRNGRPVRRIMELEPVSITRRQDVTIVDFGQNFAGRERIRFNAPPGCEIKIRHGEMLNPDGSLYTDNYRKAQAETIIIAPGGELVYEPEFTFYGFRYIEVSGITDFQVSAQVLHTDLAVTGAIDCDNALINKLVQNTIWGQRSNFLDIPTDCPQRDEKRGWTGDIQVFCQAALFNMHSMPLLRKWLADVRSTAKSDGRIANFVPIARIAKDGNYCTSGWADAIVTCPWKLYLMYGDVSILRQNAHCIYRWLDYQAEHSDNGLCCHARFADWLNMDDPTSEEFISTAYFAYDAALTSKIARLLGDENAHKRMVQYQQMAHQAFQRNFIGGNGLLKEQSQCAMAMALCFQLLTEEQRTQTVKMLAAAIEAADWHLSTGFLGTPLLLHALSDNGEIEIAYRLLEQTTLPSWLYPVTQGATTIWERWDSYSAEKGFGNVVMNSFNHYAYGAVADWLYMTAGGIRPREDAPGFREFDVMPRPGGSLRKMAVEFDSPAGAIRSQWRREKDKTVYSITVPEGSRCHWKPANGAEEILSGGQYEFEI